MEDRAARARAALAAAESAVRAGSAAEPTGPSPVIGDSTRGDNDRPGDDARPGATPTDPDSAGGPDGGSAGSDRNAASDPYAVARSIALRQLTFAPRSRAELERKLAEKGCADDVAASVLDRLTEVGLVDDEAYAEMLIRSQQANRGLSRAGLARELAAKGVDRDVADSALATVSSGQDRVRAEELVAKRLRTMAGLSADVQARRLAAMLARKGYPSGMVYSVVSQAIDQAAEHRRD